MKTRISAVMCLLCVLGSADFARAEDPSSPRVSDPYALSPDAPTMSSGTIEPYVSAMAGIAIPRSADATFTDGTQPPTIPNIDYQTKHSVGGNAGVWFPTRSKLAGFDLGVEITGFIWYADVACCVENFNFTPANGGETTEIQGVYVGSNFLIRYPMAISEAYPNGRWFPYVGVGVGAHQMLMRPGGQKGTGFLNAITDSRSTAIAYQGVGGIKVHLFKYVALFAEAKYIHAHHDDLVSDRFNLSGGAFSGPGLSGELVGNRYESTIDTIFAHAGLSIHFDVKP